MDNKKALLLFSGGLDSILAVKVLEKQNIKVTALSFETPFFNAEKAKNMAQKLGIEIIVQDITKRHLPIVKNPLRGYGKNMNPCLDCHGLMFQIAGEIMQKQDFDLIATGEVMGQRPFSQNKQALMLVAKIAGMEGKILRPLSAKHLPETDYEKEGIIDREKLLDLEGRSRKPQIALAQKWKIEDYPTPAGGCMLTDPGFSQRLKDLFVHHPEAQVDEINLLKVGRQFWVGENKVVVGRDKEDNLKLREYFDKQKMILLKLKNLPGPHGLIYVSAKKKMPEAIKLAAEKIKYYALKARDLDEVMVIYWGKKEGELII